MDHMAAIVPKNIICERGSLDFANILRRTSMADYRVGISVAEMSAAFQRLSDVMNGAGDYNRPAGVLPDGLLRCEYCGVVTDRRTGLCDHCGAPLNPR